MITPVISVAIGGAFGAVARYLVGLAMAFPLGTLTVNVLGSLVIGLVWALFAARGLQGWLPLVMTGFSGGFTTFSAFSLDTMRLVEVADMRQREAMFWPLCYCHLRPAPLDCGLQKE